MHESCRKASGEFSIRIRNRIPHNQINITTNFPAVAI